MLNLIEHWDLGLFFFFNQVSLLWQPLARGAERSIDSAGFLLVDWQVPDGYYSMKELARGKFKHFRSGIGGINNWFKERKLNGVLR